MCVVLYYGFVWFGEICREQGLNLSSEVSDGFDEGADACAVCLERPCTVAAEGIIFLVYLHPCTKTFRHRGKELTTPSCYTYLMFIRFNQTF